MKPPDDDDTPPFATPAPRRSSANVIIDNPSLRDGHKAMLVARIRDQVMKSSDLSAFNFEMMDENEIAELRKTVENEIVEHLGELYEIVERRTIRVRPQDPRVRTLLEKVGAFVELCKDGAVLPAGGQAAYAAMKAAHAELLAPGAEEP